METLSSNLTSQEVVQQRAGTPGIEAPPQPDATTADQGKVNVLALPVRPQESQVKLSLKTAGMVLLTVPFLTVSSFLLQVAQFRADLPSLDMLTIDWEEVPGVLLGMGTANLIGLPISFYVAAVLSFGFARLLKGRGSFGRHTYLIAVAILSGYGVSVSDESDSCDDQCSVFRSPISQEMGKCKSVVSCCKVTGRNEPG